MRLPECLDLGGGGSKTDEMGLSLMVRQYWGRKTDYSLFVMASAPLVCISDWLKYNITIQWDLF